MKYIIILLGCYILPLAMVAQNKPMKISFKSSDNTLNVEGKEVNTTGTLDSIVGYSAREKIFIISSKKDLPRVYSKKNYSVQKAVDAKSSDKTVLLSCLQTVPKNDNVALFYNTIYGDVEAIKTKKSKQSIDFFAFGMGMITILVLLVVIWFVKQYLSKKEINTALQDKPKKNENKIVGSPEKQKNHPKQENYESSLLEKYKTEFSRLEKEDSSPYKVLICVLDLFKEEGYVKERDHERLKDFINQPLASKEDKKQLKKEELFKEFNEKVFSTIVSRKPKNIASLKKELSSVYFSYKKYIKDFLTLLDNIDKKNQFKIEKEEILVKKIKNLETKNKALNSEIENYQKDTKEVIYNKKQELAQSIEKHKRQGKFINDLENENKKLAQDIKKIRNIGDEFLLLVNQGGNTSQTKKQLEKIQTELNKLSQKEKRTFGNLLEAIKRQIFSSNLSKKTFESLVPLVDKFQVQFKGFSSTTLQEDSEKSVFMEYLLNVGFRVYDLVMFWNDLKNSKDKEIREKASDMSLHKASWFAINNNVDFFNKKLSDYARELNQQPLATTVLHLARAYNVQQLNCFVEGVYITPEWLSQKRS